MTRLRALTASALVAAATLGAAPAAYSSTGPAGTPGPAATGASAPVAAAAPRQAGADTPRPRPAGAVGPATLLPKSLVPSPSWGPTGIDTFNNRLLLLAWNDVWWGAYPPTMGFTGNVSACVQGTTSADQHLADLETINALRGIAGVGPLTEEPTWSFSAQQGALAVAAMGQTGIWPTPYPAPGTPCLTPNAVNALDRGLRMAKAGPQGINWYVEDYANQSMQQRSLALAAGATTVGFGDVPGDSGANVTVLRPAPNVSLRTGATRSGFVAWPNAGRVPIWLADHWGFADVFTVEMTNTEILQNATVRITSGGQEVGVSSQYPSEATRLVFQPARAPKPGETWTIAISNVLEPQAGTWRNFSYTIQFVGTTFASPMIVAAYQDFLGRVPGQPEIDYHSGALWNGQRTREGFLRLLATSPEWVSRIVRKMYLDTLGRQPDAGGLAAWVELIRTGRYTVAQVASMFYSSDEFYQGLGGNNLTTWVTQLYQKLLNRAPDAGGLAAWVSYARTYGRTWVAIQFYQSLESRMTRVKGLYQTLLGRDPEPGGWSYWANVILSKGDIELAVSLAVSPEYFSRSWDRYR